MDYVDKILSAIAKSAEQIGGFIKKWGPIAVLLALVYYFVRRGWFWFGLPVLGYSTAIIIGKYTGWNVGRISYFEAICVWVFFWSFCEFLFKGKKK